MLLGAHLINTHGLAALPQRAVDLGCGCLQIFSKSPRQWQAPPVDPQQALRFSTGCVEAGLSPVVAHASYLINLATADDVVRQRSIEGMIDEVARAELLGCHYLVLHCGAHLQPGVPKDDCQGFAPCEEAALNRLAQSVATVIRRSGPMRVQLALENTAGQGTCLGARFEHLQYVLEALPDEQLVVCFDTCHALAAGHDVSSARGLRLTLQHLDDTVGLNRLAVVHLNDSKGSLGARVDRHQHIGEGAIGRAGMKRLINEPRLRRLPFILETPDSATMLETNLQAVRELRKREHGASLKRITGGAHDNRTERHNRQPGTTAGRAA